MNALRWVLTALALGLVVAAFVLASRGPERRDGSAGELDVIGSRQDGDPGRGGVAARDADLSAAARVRGAVVDQDELPVDGGSLILSCLGPDDTVRPIEGGIVKIAEDGSFEGPACRHRVCARLAHPGFVPAEPWLLEPGREHTLHARTLPRLEGEVQGPDGAPIEAARVTFIPTGPDPDPTAVVPLVTRSTVTDADGMFSVAWLERPPCDPCQEVQRGCETPPLPVLDAFVIVVSAQGLAPARAEIDVLTHDDEPVVIRLAGGAAPLVGEVVDGTGAPYSRAYVLARSLQRPREQRRADVVDGRFEVHGLGEGPHELRAIQDGVELARLASANPGDEVQLTGDVSATGPDVVLEVVDADGPVPARIDGGPFRDVTTDEDGRVSASAVLPGELRLRVRPFGRPARMVTISVPERPVEPGEPVALRVEVGDDA